MQYSQHNLAIDLEIDKQQLFGSIYDFSRPKLDVLCEYVNEILAKRFITLSESPLKALILFTNKNNRGLCLCINYHSLNVITKKQAFITFGEDVVRLFCGHKVLY